MDGVATDNESVAALRRDLNEIEPERNRQGSPRVRADASRSNRIRGIERKKNLTRLVRRNILFVIECTDTVHSHVGC